MSTHLTLVATLVLGTLSGSLAWAHGGTPNLAATEACAEQSLGDACGWDDHHGAIYRGSCRKISDSLLCVRNKPIEYRVEHHDQPVNNSTATPEQPSRSYLPVGGFLALLGLTGWGLGSRLRAAQEERDPPM